MQPGDLLFFPSQGRWYERIIARVTQGRFVHVAVAVDEERIIAAETWGIRLEPLPPERPLSSVSLSPSSKEAAQEALRWLSLQVGKRYGWVDILDQLFRLLGLPLYLGLRGSLDCSDLAACFAAMYTNDRTLMGQVLDHRQEISPNDLARYYKLPVE